MFLKGFSPTYISWRGEGPVQQLMSNKIFYLIFASVELKICPVCLGST